MTSFSFREFIFGGKTFCCCLPVRMGVIVISLLSILFSGVLSIILWFEVASSSEAMTSPTERGAFIGAGVVATLLFIASILGFSGTVVRKQLFVTIYAYFIALHFLLNVAIAAFFLYMITHAESGLAVKACQDTITNQEAKDQCTGILKIAKGVYIVVAFLVLMTEFYGIIVVTRYVRLLRNDKRNIRASRMMGSESGFHLLQKGPRYSTVPLNPGAEPFYTSPGHTPKEFDPYQFNPYEAVSRPAPAVAHIHHPSFDTSYGDDLPPAVAPVPIEVGYGGGSWTHEEITTEEKARLQRADMEAESVHAMRVEKELDEPIEADATAAEDERRRRESKSAAVPPPSRSNDGIEELPRYSLTDAPVNMPTDSKQKPS